MQLGYFYCNQEEQGVGELFLKDQRQSGDRNLVLFTWMRKPRDLNRPTNESQFMWASLVRSTIP